MEHRLISGHSPYEGVAGFSRAVVAGDRVHVAGTAPIPPDGSPVPEEAYEQAALCLRIIGEALDRAGSGLEHVVRTNIYVTAREHWEEVARAHKGADRARSWREARSARPRGIRALKREGDGGTPLGRFSIRLVLYRADRCSGRACRFQCERSARWTAGAKIRVTATTIGSSNSRRKRSADRLDRADHLYDLILVLGYNDRPRVRGEGQRDLRASRARRPSRRQRDASRYRAGI